MFRFSEKSGVHGFSGLHGTSGVYGNSGVYKVSGFNPLDLDPYLLFDAETSMIGTFENPTLDLNPATPSTLDVITATRAGVATFTDANGLIASASADTVRVDYTQGAELTPTKFQRVNYTDFSQGWTASNTTVISGDGFGGHASQKITAGSSGNKLFTGDVSGVTSGTAYTISFYVKRLVGSGRVDLIHNNITGTPISQDFTITSEFTRVTAQFNGATSGTTATNIQLRLFTAGDQIEISQPQLEEGTTASDFVANTTGSPKFITGATFGPRVPMILVEPSATNTIRWSEDSTAYNYGTGITFESSDVLAPNGQASAFKMTPNDTSSLHRGGALDTAGSWNANDVINYSVWVKTDGYDYILNIGGFFGNEAATFDTLDGSLIGNESNVISASSEDYGNGWFRYVVTYTFQNIITNNYVYSGIRLYKRDASGNATNWDATGETTGVLVYGSQFEAGNVATSYIPTDNDASGVTRAADDLVISGSAFSDFYNQSEGTFYVESVPNENTSGSFLFDLSFGDASTDRLNIFNGSGNQKVFLRTAGTTWSDNIIGSRPAGGVFSRVAISYKTNDVRASLDGVNMTTDPSATISSTLNKMTIGNRYQNPNYLNGRIRRLIFWPYHSDSL